MQGRRDCARYPTCLRLTKVLHVQCWIQELHRVSHPTILKQLRPSMLLYRPDVGIIAQMKLFSNVFLQKKSWTLHGFNTQRDESETLIAAYLYLKMLYHSISTSTLCGKTWFNGYSRVTFFSIPRVCSPFSFDFTDHSTWWITEVKAFP